MNHMVHEMSPKWVPLSLILTKDNLNEPTASIEATCLCGSVSALLTNQINEWKEADAASAVQASVAASFAVASIKYMRTVL